MYSILLYIMRWVRHVGHVLKILFGRPKGRDHSHEQGSKGMIILKWILEK
jgi:hypothetical protein